MLSHKVWKTKLKSRCVPFIMNLRYILIIEVTFYLFIYLFIQYFKRVTFISMASLLYGPLNILLIYKKHGNKRTVICTYMHAWHC